MYILVHVVGAHMGVSNHPHSTCTSANSIISTVHGDMHITDRPGNRDKNIAPQQIVDKCNKVISLSLYGKFTRCLCLINVFLTAERKHKVVWFCYSSTGSL